MNDAPLTIDLDDDGSHYVWRWSGVLDPGSKEHYILVSGAKDSVLETLSARRRPLLVDLRGLLFLKREHPPSQGATLARVFLRALASARILGVSRAVLKCGIRVAYLLPPGEQNPPTGYSNITIDHSQTVSEAFDTFEDESDAVDFLMSETPLISAISEDDSDDAVEFFFERRDVDEEDD